MSPPIYRLIIDLTQTSGILIFSVAYFTNFFNNLSVAFSKSETQHFLPIYQVHLQYHVQHITIKYMYSTILTEPPSSTPTVLCSTYHHQVYVQYNTHRTIVKYTYSTMFNISPSSICTVEYSQNHRQVHL